MTPADFVAYAEQVAVAPRTGPAGYRSAISRAYYGAYHAALSFLEHDVGQRLPKLGNEHLLVQRFLEHSRVPEAVKAALDLGNLHTSRKAADYDLADAASETPVNARFCAERGRRILELLDRCKETALLDSIRDGLLDYRRRTNQ